MQDCSYPALDTSHAIGGNLIMTAVLFVYCSSNASAITSGSYNMYYVNVTG